MYDKQGYLRRREKCIKCSMTYYLKHRKKYLKNFKKYYKTHDRKQYFRDYYQNHKVTKDVN